MGSADYGPNHFFTPGQDPDRKIYPVKTMRQLSGGWIALRKIKPQKQSIRLQFQGKRIRGFAFAMTVKRKCDGVVSIGAS
jgi:hypothetical protein